MNRLDQKATTNSPKGTIMKIRSISDLYYAIPATVS